MVSGDKGGLDLHFLEKFGNVNEARSDPSRWRCSWTKTRIPNHSIVSHNRDKIGTTDTKRTVCHLYSQLLVETEIRSPNCNRWKQ